MNSVEKANDTIMVATATVAGHDLKPGDVLTITESPSAKGECTKFIGRILRAKGLAAYRSSLPAKKQKSAEPAPAPDQKVAAPEAPAAAPAKRAPRATGGAAKTTSAKRGAKKPAARKPAAKK